MENKECNKFVENSRTRVELFTAPIQIKNRIITHAESDIIEIASSKFWKFTTYFRQIKAIISNPEDNLLEQLKFFFLSTQEFLFPIDEDLFDLDKLSPITPCIEKQHDIFNQRVLPSSKIAVIVHLYYVDLWEETQSYLQNIREKFDLFISIPMGNDQISSKIQRYYPKAYIYMCPNRGRDIAPFVEIISAIRDCEYNYICKIHTKKSSHLSEGVKWRKTLLNDLLGSEEQVNNILNFFQVCPEVGMIVPKGYLYSAVEISTITNTKNIKRLCQTTGVVYQGFGFEYPAGSMFWCQAGILRPLAESGIQTKDFPVEQRQLNNSLAHAIERFFGILVLDNHQYIIESSILPRDSCE